MTTIKKTAGSDELWVKCVATVMEACCGSIGTVKMAPGTNLTSNKAQGLGGSPDPTVVVILMW